MGRQDRKNIANTTVQILTPIFNPNPHAPSNNQIYFEELEYLVTALVPSETACWKSATIMERTIPLQVHQGG